MLTLEERLVVVNLYEDLGSYRAVAELTGRDHKTVKAWVKRQREGNRGPVSRARLTDPYLPLLRAKLEATQGRIRGRQLLRVLRAAGYQGSRRTMERTLRRLRSEWAHEHRVQLG